MGQSLTREQRSYMEVLQKVLKTHGGNISQLSWFPQEGMLGVVVWEQVGDELWQRRDDKAKKLLVIWQQVFSALLRLQAVNATELLPYAATAGESTVRLSVIPGPDSEPDDSFNPGSNDPEQEAGFYPPPNMHCCVQPTAPASGPPPRDRPSRACSPGTAPPKRWGCPRMRTAHSPPPPSRLPGEDLLARRQGYRNAVAR